MSLTGTQYKKFSKALRGAYNYNELTRMLKFGLERDIQNITLAQTYEQVVFDLIGAAERQGWILNLLAAAVADNPGNAELILFAEGFGITPEIVYVNPEGETSSGSLRKSALQRMIDAANSPLDISVWRRNLGKVEVQTCSIEIRNAHAGTGFLLGPDLVMTNYHVMQSVIQGQEGLGPSDVSVRFDFKRDKDGQTIHSGTLYGLDSSDWLLHHSPYSQSDQLGSENNDSAENELDFALLRLKERPGELPVSGNPDAESRGWIQPSTIEHNFTANRALYIVQHPNGQPMKLAMDTHAVTGLNSNGTRVRYRTNTDPGSSGSPCFDREWMLVALHQSGDINTIPKWNQGIPFAKIMNLLEEEGVADVLDDE